MATADVCNCTPNKVSVNLNNGIMGEVIGASSLTVDGGIECLPTTDFPDESKKGFEIKHNRMNGMFGVGDNRVTILQESGAAVYAVEITGDSDRYFYISADALQAAGSGISIRKN